MEGSDKCVKSNCAYFSEKRCSYRKVFSLHIFIGTGIILTLCIILWFTFQRSQKTIVNCHKANYEKTLSLIDSAKSSSARFDINDKISEYSENAYREIASLLKLEQSKIESALIILSVWAGILMIVFLVFSIYSAFKTDELLQQGREGVSRIFSYSTMVDNQIEKIEKKVKEETNKIQRTVHDNIKDINSKAQSEFEKLNVDVDKFYQVIDEKSNDFNQKYTTFVKLINKSAEDTIKIFNDLLSTYKNTASESRSTKTV